MAYRITSNGTHVQPDVVEIVVDTLAELQDVPTTFGIGSDCIVIEDSSVHYLGNDHIWHEL